MSIHNISISSISTLAKEEGAKAKASVGRVWHSQQKAVFSAYTDTKDNLAIRARAGTGKTTLLVELTLLAMERSETFWIMSFGNDAKNEFISRGVDPQNSTTQHAFGRQVCIHNGAKVDTEKANKIFKNVNLPYMWRKKRWVFNRLISTLKNSALLPPVAYDGVSEREEAKLRKTIKYILVKEEYITDREETEDGLTVDWAVDIVVELFNSHYEVYAFIDIDDMVWMPWARKWEGKRKRDVCFTDEYQDTNPCSAYLAGISAKRQIIIGDDKQAIYSWRGAGENAFDDGVTQFDCVVLPLSLTYRCGKKIVKFVEEIVPDFTAHEDNKEGSVGYIDIDLLAETALPGDFILSRGNAANVPIALDLFRLGKKAFIRGSNLPSKINGLCRMAKATDINDFLIWLVRYEATRLSKLEDLQDEDAIKEFKQLTQVVRTLCDGWENYPVSTVSDLQGIVHSMFKDSYEDAIMLSTVHRAKGMEAKRVFVNGVKRGDGEEDNIYYVACTRAEQELTIVIEAE